MNTDANDGTKGGGKNGGPSIEPKIYFYLVTLTSLGRSQDNTTISDDHKRVSVFIRNLKGVCVLYTVPGPYDWVSLVTHVTGDEAITIQRYIEQSGYAKAVLLPGEIDPK